MSKKKKSKGIIYRTMKVFDCQWDPGMPEDVKDAFFKIFDEAGNDVYVEYEIANERFSTAEKPIPGLADENSEWALRKKLLDDWLIANGAEGPKSDDSSGETVLIKHWW
jgi:hypothetical protein